LGIIVVFFLRGLMRTLTTALNILALTLLPTFAFAAKFDVSPTELFAREATGAKNWKELLGKSGALLPVWIRPELTKAAAGLEFPSITFKKTSVQIKDMNGSHLTIHFLQGGKVFFEENEWQIQPLIPISEQISIISNLIAKNSKNSQSVWPRFTPVAFAALNNSNVAIAAFTVSAGWKAKQCGEAQLSTSQNQECPLMTVGMQPSKSTKDASTLKLGPIAMHCPPKGNPGFLELISKNQLGSTRRMRVAFKDEGPRSVEIALAPPGGALKIVTYIDLSSERDSEMLSLGKQFSEQALAIFNQVCEGTDQNKHSYFAALEGNRQILSKPSPAIDLNEESGAHFEPAT
jgi:hypothetical protein